MARDRSFTFEELSNLIVSYLKKSELLHYLKQDSIIISSPNEKDTIPTFQDYLIRLFAPDSGFLQKTPKIGKYYRNTYIVAIELWVKSGSSVTNRLSSGNISGNKGIFEFFQDVNDTLEHNIFDGDLDPYPGSSISDPVTLESTEQLTEGIGFFWFGNQDNIK